jgi:hypothetical protein
MANPKRSTTRRSALATPAVVEFTPDYSQVKHDLKRIGILAGSIFAGLIVLSFFLR